MLCDKILVRVCVITERARETFHGACYLKRGLAQIQNFTFMNRVVAEELGCFWCVVTRL
jgi:hypothetical protein